MAGTKKAVESYGLDPTFERAVAACVCTRPKFFGVVGRELSPERFKLPEVSLAIRAAQAHAKDAGHGPTHASVVMQRLRRWHTEGSITIEEVNAVADMLFDAEDDQYDENDIATELVPVLQKLIRSEAALMGLEEYGKSGDFTKVEELLQRAKVLGVQDRSTGSKLGLGALDDIKRLRQADRLSLGLLELDAGLSGGLQRGKAAMMVAAAKAGKSFWLTHIASVTLLTGKFVALATLELSEEDQQSRLISNLTGVPIDAIVEGTADDVVALELEKLQSLLGVFRTKFFPATATTMVDIIEWVKSIEEEEGRKVDLLELDYIDKLGSTNKNHKSTYDIQGQCAEDFRLYVHGRSMYGWTASQPKRRDAKDRTKRIELDDIADSQNKVRVLDLILTAHRPSEYEVEIYVAGSRNSKGEFSVGPFVTQLEIGRIVPVER